jgi:hypothetical protein
LTNLKRNTIFEIDDIKIYLTKKNVHGMAILKLKTNFKIRNNLPSEIAFNYLNKVISLPSKGSSSIYLSIGLKDLVNFRINDVKFNLIKS